MANLVMIAGSGHGGWWFDPISDRLRDLGHRVYAPSLSGLDHENPTDGPVNLDTHINDVLEIIEKNSLEDVVLLAHSYGGMVSTGVAAKTAAKVSGLIYLDAILPKPGQRLWDLIDDDFRNGFLASAFDGLNSYPDPGFKAIRPRVMPHPLGTILQPLNYDEAIFSGPKKLYVFAEEYFHNPAMLSPFKPIYEELSQRPDWITKKVPFGHDLLEEAPEVIFDLVAEFLN
jgi:pimeloyl-ACP methyl ester carboxylesterase